MTDGDFRVRQIQSLEHASSTVGTQYWSYTPVERQFEHRVLKALDPPSWGPLDGLNFSLRISEVAELKYDLASLRVFISIAPNHDSTASPNSQRNDLMVEFKRCRSMKRFLALSRKMGVQTTALPDRMLSR